MRPRLPVALLLASLIAWPAPGPAHAADAPLAAPTGIVRVTSPVPGAMVYVDGEQAGEAPIVRYLAAGPHTIRVAVDNFDPFARRVDVTAGTTIEVAAQLLPGPGTVEFEVQPKGAKVSLNGGPPSSTPVRLNDLKDGTYSYKLEATGCEPEEGSFTFKKGKNLFISAHLKATAGLVELSTDPVGARAWLDGQSVGATPLTLEGVALGKHVVRLDLDDHATVFRRFDNTDGSKGEIEVKLPTQGAALQVDTGFPDGSVSLEGLVVGTGPTVRVPVLEHGRYELAVSAPDHQPATLSLDLPSSGELHFKAELAGTTEPGPSRIVRVRPLYERWGFWTAVALGGGAVGTGSWLVAEALKPEVVPPSDVVVVMP